MACTQFVLKHPLQGFLCEDKVTMLPTAATHIFICAGCRDGRTHAHVLLLAHSPPRLASHRRTHTRGSCIHYKVVMLNGVVRVRLVEDGKAGRRVRSHGRGNIRFDRIFVYRTACLSNFLVNTQQLRSKLVFDIPITSHYATNQQAFSSRSGILKFVRH